MIRPVDTPEQQPSDAIVVGAGAAGLTAGLFLGRSGRSVLVIDPFIGNHMVNAGTIDNFPGFPDGISGAELWSLLHRQAASAGVRFAPATVKRVEALGGVRRSFRVLTDSASYDGLTVLACTGSRLRALDVEGESRLTGLGVSHCATCDGPIFSGQAVAVVGGGDSALDEALVLSEMASEVTIFHRGASPTGQMHLQKQVSAAENVRVRSECEVIRLEGSARLDAIVVRDTSGVDFVHRVGGVFGFVGLEPNTDFLQPLVDLDDSGHVITDGSMQTSVAGVFAAGDIRRDSSSQFVSAAGDGASAALAAHRFLGPVEPNATQS